MCLRSGLSDPEQPGRPPSSGVLASVSAARQRRPRQEGLCVMPSPSAQSGSATTSLAAARQPGTTGARAAMPAPPAAARVTAGPTPGLRRPGRRRRPVGRGNRGMAAAGADRACRAGRAARLVINVSPPFRLDYTVWALRRGAHNEVDRFERGGNHGVGCRVRRTGPACHGQGQPAAGQPGGGRGEETQRHAGGRHHGGYRMRPRRRWASRPGRRPGGFGVLCAHDAPCLSCGISRGSFLLK